MLPNIPIWRSISQQRDNDMFMTHRMNEHIAEIKLIQHQLYRIAIILMHHTDTEVQERGRNIAYVSRQINEWLEKLYDITTTSRYDTIPLSITFSTLEEALEALNDINQCLESSQSTTTSSHWCDVVLQAYRQALLRHIEHRRSTSPSHEQNASSLTTT